MMQNENKSNETNTPVGTPAYTPGPWQVDDPADPLEVTNADCTPVCVFGFSASRDWTNYDNHVANARLIATAPELLEALQDAYNWLIEEKGHPYEQVSEEAADALYKYKAVIAKATEGA